MIMKVKFCLGKVTLLFYALYRHDLKRSVSFRMSQYIAEDITVSSTKFSALS
jgi:hypothetical protein